MSAFDQAGANSAARGWHYHPLEIVVHSADPESSLARNVVQILSVTREVGSVRHGADVDVGRPTSSHSIDVNGQRSQYAREGHLDLPLQRVLLAEADLVVVEGSLDSIGPRVIELPPPDGSVQNLSGLALGADCVLFGERRPVEDVPPGGVAWFEPSELSDLVEHLLEMLERKLRSRPLWGLVLAGQAAAPDTQAWLNLLSNSCERVFVAGPGEGDAFETAPDNHPALSDLGRILSCLETHPESAFLVGGGAFTPASDVAVQVLLNGRDPFRLATAIREPDTHLPGRLPTLWEPKARSRILTALAADLRCSQRILTQSRIQLLDPIPGA
jgi:hypothetical protein